MLNALGGWNNAIRSIRVIIPGVAVQVCDQENLGGTCTTVSTTLAQLFGGWDAQISSLRVL